MLFVALFCYWGAPGEMPIPTAVEEAFGQAGCPESSQLALQGRQLCIVTQHQPPAWTPLWLQHCWGRGSTAPVHSRESLGRWTPQPSHIHSSLQGQTTWESYMSVYLRVSTLSICINKAKAIY